MAGVSQILGVRMAEWLRPGLWELLTIKLRGIEPGQVLITKKSIGWAVGVKITSRRYCGWHRPNLEGRMAEWIRPRTFIAENRLNIRRISVGSISCPSKKSIGWAAGVKITSRRYYGWHRPNLNEGRMTEWLKS